MEQDPREQRGTNMCTHDPRGQLVSLPASVSRTLAGRRRTRRTRRTGQEHQAPGQGRVTIPHPHTTIYATPHRWLRKRDEASVGEVWSKTHKERIDCPTARTVRRAPIARGVCRIAQLPGLEAPHLDTWIPLPPSPFHSLYSAHIRSKF